MTTTTTTTTTKSYAPVVVAPIMEQDPGRRNPAGSGALSGYLASGEPCPAVPDFRISLVPRLQSS